MILKSAAVVACAMTFPQPGHCPFSRKNFTMVSAECDTVLSPGDTRTPQLGDIRPEDGWVYTGERWVKPKNPTPVKTTPAANHSVHNQLMDLIRCLKNRIEELEHTAQAQHAQLSKADKSIKCWAQHCKEAQRRSSDALAEALDRDCELSKAEARVKLAQAAQSRALQEAAEERAAREAAEARAAEAEARAQKALDTAANARRLPACCICLTEEVTNMYPCGHMCVCSGCASTNAVSRKCPICRTEGVSKRVYVGA